MAAVGDASREKKSLSNAAPPASYPEREGREKFCMTRQVIAVVFLNTQKINQRQYDCLTLAQREMTKVMVNCPAA